MEFWISGSLQFAWPGDDATLDRGRAGDWPATGGPVPSLNGGRFKCRVLREAHAVACRPAIGPTALPGGGTRPVAWGQIADAFGARASGECSYGLYELPAHVPYFRVRFPPPSVPNHNTHDDNYDVSTGYGRCSLHELGKTYSPQPRAL